MAHCSIQILAHLVNLHSSTSGHCRPKRTSLWGKTFCLEGRNYSGHKTFYKSRGGWFLFLQWAVRSPSLPPLVGTAASWVQLCQQHPVLPFKESRSVHSRSPVAPCSTLPEDGRKEANSSPEKHRAVRQPGVVEQGIEESGGISAAVYFSLALPPRGPCPRALHALCFLFRH